MTATQDPIATMDAFSARYDYDMRYMREIFEHAPKAFEQFSKGQPMSQHRNVLSREAHYIARVAVMLAERCGGCARLNLRMALEAGVDRGLLEDLLERPEALPPALRDVRDHAFDVATTPTPDADRVARLRAEYGDAGVAELAVVLAGSRLFTTAKRGMLQVEPGPVRTSDF